MLLVITLHAGSFENLSVITLYNFFVVLIIPSSSFEKVQANIFYQNLESSHSISKSKDIYTITEKLAV